MLRVNLIFYNFQNYFKYEKFINFDSTFKYLKCFLFISSNINYKHN